MWTTQPKRPRLPYGAVLRTPRPNINENQRGIAYINAGYWAGRMAIENYEDGECVVIRILFCNGTGSAQYCYDGIKEKGGLR